MTVVSRMVAGDARRRAVPRRALLALGALLVGACAGGAASGSGGLPLDPPRVSPALGLDMSEFTRLPQGLFYKDVAVGTGAVATDRSRVTVAYRAVLMSNGLQVDSSAGLTVRMSDPIIRGWKLGIPGMRVGGTRILVIPPELGYGFKEVGAIPPNSALAFRIQLIAVQ